jgi:hypothetical protein
MVHMMEQVMRISTTISEPIRRGIKCLAAMVFALGPAMQTPDERWQADQL